MSVDQDLVQDIEGAAYLLGRRRGPVTKDQYRRLAKELKRLAHIAEQQARTAAEYTTPDWRP